MYTNMYVYIYDNTLVFHKFGCKCFIDNNRCFGWYDRGFPSKDTHNRKDIRCSGQRTECSIKQLYDKSNSVNDSRPWRPVKNWQEKLIIMNKSSSKFI